MSGEMKAPTAESVQARIETRKVSVRELPLSSPQARPESTIPPIPTLSDDEKTKSQKTQSRAFDDLVGANLKLVRSVDALVERMSMFIKASFIIQVTNLTVLLVVLFLFYKMWSR
jgi:uncharacterized protein (DUF1800 family)